MMSNIMLDCKDVSIEYISMLNFQSPDEFNRN